MLKVVPDEIMRALELRKGTVDMVVNDLSPDVVHQLAAEKAVTIAEAPGTDYAYVGVNMRDPILKDRRVRHALGHAIDRQAIVDHLRRGLARPAVGILPPASWAFEAGVFQFTHDPAKAQALLEEAGYRDPDGDGPEPRLRLSMKVSTNEFIRLQAAVIQQDLKRVGIDLDVRSYEFATLYADVLKGNFQLFTLQWVGVSDPDMLRRVFHSKQMPPNGFNRGYYENPEVDRLIDAAMVAESDDERRQVVRRRAAGGGGRRAVHQPLVQDQHRGVRYTHRGRQADALGGVHVPAGSDAKRIHDYARGFSRGITYDFSFSISCFASSANGVLACCSTIWVSVLRASSVLPAAL